MPGAKRGKAAAMISIPEMSEKQLILATAGGTDYRRILAIGVPRSGKTFGIGTGFPLWVQKNFSGHRFLLASKTMTQLREGVVPEIAATCERLGIACIPRYQEKKLIIGDEGGMNEILLYDANNAASSDKLRTLTFAGAWVNEATLVPSRFMEEVETRCSVRGAKIWMDGNAQGPKHHIKTKYVDHQEDMSVMLVNTSFEDNPTLSPEFVESMRRTMTGVFYRRNFLNEWAAATGTVYPTELMRVEPAPDEKPYRRDLVVDGGIATTTHAGLFHFHHDPTAVWCEDLYRHDARDLGQLPESVHSERIAVALAGRSIRRIVVDPHARQLKAELARVLPRVPIVDAQNDVHDGIELTAAWIANGNVRFLPQARHTLDEASAYVWDEKAADRGESKPRKTFDHAVDVLRYFCLTAARRRAVRITVNG